MSLRQPRWVISGGIGSGKSQMRHLLSQYGFVTIDADSVGHDVLEPNGAAFDEVTRRWPQVVVGGQVDRRALGRIVFGDSLELATLESITHPLIFGRIRSDLGNLAGPAAVEVPLLEHHLGGGWVRVVVDTRDQQRLKRIVDRGLSEGEAEARMVAQPGRREWLAVADVVVPNHGSLHELETSVQDLVRVLAPG